MKRLISNHRLLLFAGVFLAGILVFSAPVHAAWQMIHGHGGHVQDETKLLYPDLYIGWSLYIVQNPNTYNWVHFAVPTLGDNTKGARYVKIKFNTVDEETWVEKVHIYNGDSFIKEFTGHWTGYKTLTLDLKAIKSFPSGLGISVQYATSSAAGDHVINFFGAGANFVNKP